MRRYLFATVLIWSCSLSSYSVPHSRDPRHEFSYHEVIEPKVGIRGKRQMRDLKSLTDWRFENDLRSVAFTAYGKEFRIEISKNEHLFSPRYSEIYQENGKHLSDETTNREESNCHYKGHLKGVRDSWAALNACDGLNGLIYDGEEFFHLYNHENSSNSLNLISKVSDLKERNISCGVKDPSRKSVRSIHGEITEHRFRHSPEWHFPHHDKNTTFVELMVVADNNMFWKYRNKKAVFQRVREIVNIVHAIYIPLNVFVVLVGVLVWNERNFISVTPNSDNTLNLFANYRTNHLQNYANDNAQLITDVNFGENVVGLAFTGSMCTTGHSAGINQDYSSTPGSVAAVMAHEMGHNFNMKHDEDSCDCHGHKKCIMSKSTSTGMTWSSCSKSVLRKFLKDTKGSCLTNLPKHVALPECGNGVIELNEECDCGLPQVCDNPCCNSTNCRFFENATCSSGDCCDMKNCKVMKVSTMCRGNQSECDLPEFCDGKSSFCPNDVFLQDGTECKDGKAYCFQGKCQTHDDQCHFLWGPQSKSSLSCCYYYNTKGNNAENCGYDTASKSYYKCHESDSLCGTLHCSSTNSSNLDLKVGTSVATLVRYRDCSFMRGHPKPPRCFVAVVDFGLRTPNPGSVTSGTKCGENKVCLSQKCINVKHLKKPLCPRNCSENGVCNSKGHCHCIMGFGPPECDLPGVGGSVDSGPPMDPDAGTDFKITLYIMFFFIYPCVLITVSTIYLYCYDDSKQREMEKVPSVPLSPPEIRPSLHRFPRPSLKSASEDIQYEAFTSEEDEDNNAMADSNTQNISNNFWQRLSKKKVQTQLPNVPAMQRSVKNRHKLPNKTSSYRAEQVKLQSPSKGTSSKQLLCDGVILHAQTAPRVISAQQNTHSPKLQNTPSPLVKMGGIESKSSSVISDLKKHFEATH